MEITESFEDDKIEFFNMLAEFDSNWDGHQVQLRVTKYQIKLTSPVFKSFLCPLNGAGPTLKKFKRAEVDERSSMKIIKYFQSK